MAFGDDMARWIEANAAPEGATVHAHRRPADFGSADALIVAQEKQSDEHLFGGGLGSADGGESVHQIGWWIVNTSRPAAQRTPQRALDGLEPVYRALLAVNRQTIGSRLVRHVDGGLGPVLAAPRPRRDRRLRAGRSCSRSRRAK